jgi:hypothetical protein
MNTLATQSNSDLGNQLSDPAPPTLSDPTYPDTPKPELPPMDPPEQISSVLQATTRDTDTSSPLYPNEPTEEGQCRWPPDGYLKLNSIAGDPDRLACVCAAACQPDCKGECGCEACTLAWLVYQDERALWGENGELLNVIDLGPGWQRVADPRQLRLRFDLDKKMSNEVHLSPMESVSTESPDVPHKRYRSIGDSNMHTDLEKNHRDISSPSVPPVLDTHRDWVPGSLEWQKSLPEQDEGKRKRANLAENGEDEAGGLETKR